MRIESKVNKILMICLIVTLFIVGCTRKGIDDQKIEEPKVLLDRENNDAQHSSGLNENKTIVIEDSETIDELIDKGTVKTKDLIYYIQYTKNDYPIIVYCLAKEKIEFNEVLLGKIQSLCESEIQESSKDNVNIITIENNSMVTFKRYEFRKMIGDNSQVLISCETIFINTNGWEKYTSSYGDLNSPLVEFSYGYPTSTKNALQINLIDEKYNDYKFNTRTKLDVEQSASIKNDAMKWVINQSSSKTKDRIMFKSLIIAETSLTNLEIDEQSSLYIQGNEIKQDITIQYKY